jgi:hypothetical protein
MPTVDYLPVATDAGANVDSQAAFAGSGYQTLGFTSGVALSRQINKCLRQSSMVGAAVANFIANELGINVLDDGNIANLITNLTNAIASLAASGSAPKMVVVPFSATPVFACASANPVVVNFEITLTGNVTSSTITGLTAGQRVTFHVLQDGAGGHTFVPPVNVPMDAIDTTANQVNTQMFSVLAGGSLVAITPMTVKL